MWPAWFLSSGQLFSNTGPLIISAPFSMSRDSTSSEISWTATPKRTIHYGKNTLIRRLYLMNAWWMSWIRLLMFSLSSLVISFYLQDELAESSNNTLGRNESTHLLCHKKWWLESISRRIFLFLTRCRRYIRRNMLCRMVLRLSLKWRSYAVASVFGGSYWYCRSISYTPSTSMAYY